MSDQQQANSTATKAVIVLDKSDNPLPNLLVKLDANDNCGPRWGRTNADGYVAWGNFPDSVLDTYVAVWNKTTDQPQYAQSLTGPTRLSPGNQSIRIGGSSQSPSDIVLPPFESGGAFPAVPTREQVCAGQQHFQGVLWDTEEWGTIPLFTPFIFSAGEKSRQDAYAKLRALGDTKLGVALSYRYTGPDARNAYQNIPGANFTQNLDHFIELLTEVITEGFFPDIFLAGDGQSTGPGYNDPRGWTYGYQNMMAYLPSVLAALEGAPAADLTKYCQTLPGYDGVVTPGGGWQPNQVDSYLTYRRSLNTGGYSALEFGAPYCHWGGGRANYLSISGQALDSIYLEMIYPAVGDPLWQPSARMLGPKYNRPADQPSGDDPPPTSYYLEGGTPRGDWFVSAYEDGLYEWVRSLVTAEQLQLEGSKLKNIGYSITGFGNY